MKTALGRAQAAALAVVAVAVIGCEEAPQQKVERVRAIKPYYVSEPAGGDVRRYSGTIIAANTSALGFAVSGTVKTGKGLTHRLYRLTSRATNTAR